MKRHKLKVEKRDILGKKVKRLRKEGILPANIYGKDIKSIAVQLPYRDFQKVYKETGLLDVEVNGQTKPALIHNVQVDHYKDLILHADFYAVDLKEKVKTTVPIRTLGEAKAVVDKVGLLLQPISEIEIEALPEDLPENIQVNVQHLAGLNDQITVDSLMPPKGVTILTPPSQVVAKIGELISKEAQQQAAAEAAAAEAAKAAATTAETARTETAEGAKPETAATAPKPEEKPGEKETPTKSPEQKPTPAPKTTPQPAKEQKPQVKT